MSNISAGCWRWLGAIGLGVGLGSGGLRAAELPVRTYRPTYVPAAFTVPGPQRIDDHGVLYGARIVSHTPTTPSTEFLIFRPVADGTHPAGVQAIPAPVTGWNGQFGVLDINNLGQFITAESSPGFDHRFVYNGSQFVELRDPRRPANESPIFSDQIFPQSIHDDGSIWGVTVGDPSAGSTDFGAIVRWDQGGTGVMVYHFTGNDDPVRAGPFRNELGAYLRFDRDIFTGIQTHARLWDGLSSRPDR